TPDAPVSPTPDAPVSATPTPAATSPTPAAPVITTPDGNGYLVAFPANEDGKTEYSAAVFDAAFRLAVVLPDGMTIDSGKSLYPDGISGTFSNIPVLGANGIAVGSLGYNIYDPDALAGVPAAEFSPMMVYNQIGLGAHYSFLINEKYDVVSDTGALATATTYVYNDLAFSGNGSASGNYGEADYNFGIVSYSKTLPVYVAFDLDRSSFTPEQIDAIAKSILLGAGVNQITFDAASEPTEEAIVLYNAKYDDDWLVFRSAVDCPVIFELTTKETSIDAIAAELGRIMLDYLSVSHAGQSFTITDYILHSVTVYDETQEKEWLKSLNLTATEAYSLTQDQWIADYDCGIEWDGELAGFGKMYADPGAFPGGLTRDGSPEFMHWIIQKTGENTYVMRGLPVLLALYA
ncbi:MAG: hypothetical protein LBS90_06155, partial [Oscillospiraceae bacterium]|nr:hypothetical protein [Oscillospiraceae bacterium]